MEIKKGYKMTDVGVIPEDWEVKSIGEIAKTTSGGTPSREDDSLYIGKNRWFTTSELNDGYIYDSIEHISDEAIKITTARIVPANSILMAMYGATIGKLAIITKESSTNQACCAIMVNSDIVMKYVFYNLLFLRQNIIELGVGAGQPNISQSIVRSIHISIPSKKEQQAIADALTKVDNLIMSLSKVIEKKKLIKKGTMQKLLSGEVRLDGYNNIIKSVNLSDIGEIKAGGTPSTNVPSYWGGTINWLQSGAVKNRVLDIRDVEKTITYDGLASSSAYLIKENSVLIAITGATCGNIAYLPFKSAANQSVVAIQVNVGFNSKYIFYMLIQNSDKIVNNRGGSAQGGVAVNILKEIELCIHEDIDEQTAIADILTTMDNEIEALEKERDKYKCIKQGMMQQLLTGKIRLTCQ